MIRIGPLLVLGVSLCWSSGAWSSPSYPLCSEELDFSVGYGYADRIRSLAATLREEIARGEPAATKRGEDALRQRWQEVALVYDGMRKAIFGQLGHTDSPANAYLRQRLGQEWKSRLGPLRMPIMVNVEGPDPYHDHRLTATNLERNAANWEALLAAESGANAARAEYCSRDSRNEAVAGQTPEASGETQVTGRDGSTTGPVGSLGASDSGPTVVSQPEDAAQTQFERDQLAAKKAAEQRAANEARLREMQAERERAEQESLERVADAVSKLDIEEQETVAAMLFAATAAYVGYGTVSGNVDFIQISSSFLLTGTGFGNVLTMIKLNVDGVKGRKCSLKQCLFGRDPVYGAPLTIRFGTGMAAPSVGAEDIRSVQALEGGAYRGVVSGMTVRVAPVRLSIEAVRHSGSFTPVSGGDAKKSVAWGLTAGAGAQLFDGGLLSPWGEARVSTLPNCGDEGWMITGDVVGCSSADMYKVGAGGGGYQAHWAVGNTFSLRSCWATGGVEQTQRLSLALDVSYQVNAPSGTGPRVALGGEICMKCR